MSKKILIALQTFSEYSEIPLKLLKNADVNIVLNNLGHRLNKTEIIRLGSDCEGIIAGIEPYDEEVLNKLTKLKCISRCGVGVDSINLEIARQKGITVLNTPDAVIQPVAEMTIAMAFDLLRLLTYHTSILKSNQWKKKAGHLLYGSKVGIIGLGRIGKKVAELFRALDADVYGSDLYPDKTWAKKHNVKILPIGDILEKVDILSIHVSSNNENTFFLGEKEISRLKKGSVLINTSRGQFLDENALYEALKSGHLAGAALDVFGQEPYGGPLKDLDNVILTPHISTLTEESRTQMEIESTENILKYFNCSIIKD
jgi:D-3-phosphoglycerate dehydrogenase